ncbi:PP2C family serine/threonine-protein phosphatase [Jeotgalibacillus salarius]|uniref:Phosphoserine phosphatase n=1 Tax=Jeotgalibacillus salarius TaxID=546023 RepID=A0A4Y8LL51_9BACL|nr:PP2C family serine/threonine-protein phosphatase [Jeotgalibacillus salarius]TFE01967.1 phosphoserine phosphatase [Jeotgalibacillus salarius]
MEVLDNSLVTVHAGQYTKKGRQDCGDSYYFTATDDYFICVLADGLGSGKYAHEASQAVCSVVEEHVEEDVAQLMVRANDSVVKKRGAAVAIVKIEYATRQVTYSCVGNIRFYFYSEEGKLTYPLPVTGYLSGRPQEYKTQSFTYEDGASFLIHSDGLQITRVRPLLQSGRSIDYISTYLDSIVSEDDDTTFIIGRLP